jgi:hypothetical protein
MVVGVGWCFVVLGALSIGVFILPVAIIATVVLARQPGAREHTAGVLSGLGFPILYVAFLNRHGPGMHCTTTPTSESCSEHTTPVPFLVSGIALVALGVLIDRRRAIS